MQLKQTPRFFAFERSSLGSCTTIVQRFARLWIAAVCIGLCTSGYARCETVVTAVDIGLPNVVALRVRGTFDDDVILRFKAAVADIPTGTRVVAILESGGGLVTQGFALGRFFYDAKIPTVITNGALCASACTDAFLAGRDPKSGGPLRILSSSGSLGFHNRRLRPLPPRDYSKQEMVDLHKHAMRLTYDSIEYFRSVEAPIEAIILHSGTRPEKVYVPPPSELLDVGITVLNEESGKFISPTNISERVRR